MDSTYKAQLINKLDSITALEKSGYGLVRKPRETTSNIFMTAIVALLSVIACSLLVIAISLI